MKVSKNRPAGRKKSSNPPKQKRGAARDTKPAAPKAPRKSKRTRPNTLKISEAEPERKSDVDLREALFNDGATGPITQIQVSTERIVQLRGILFDLDPHLYTGSPLWGDVPQDPDLFYEQVARHWLSRDPVLDQAEVRMTGSGLHAILWFDSPVQFQSEAERTTWARRIEVVQAALPIDPQQPGITATTRALGSINGKNGQVVKQLKAGTPVTEAQVMDLYDRMVATPCQTFLRIVTGQERISPCPLCGKQNSELAGLGHFAKCYGSCGRVKLDEVFNLAYQPRSAAALKKGA